MLRPHSILAEPRRRRGHALLRFVLAAMLACLCASLSFAGTVTGTVTNGTTNKAASGVQVILINLQGTMQPVANTTTDAQGRYQIAHDSIGAGPMLLRAVYRGVNYHQPLTPGMATADIQVFEPTDKASAFSITAHAIILQPNGADLTVGEEFNIANNTQPPLAYYKSGGSFVFTLPQGAQLGEVSAGGSSGMPVLQTPTSIDKVKGTWAIDFPFRPGNSEVRIAYKVPYPENATTLRTTSPYPSSDVAYFAPPTVSVTADGFAPSGETQGFNVYLRKSVNANAALTALISGTAPPRAANDNASGDNSQNPSVNSRADSGDAAATAASLTTMPARLDSVKWVLLGGFTAIFVLGAVFVMRRSQPAAAIAGGPQIPAPKMRPAAPPQSPAPPATSVADLDRSVHNSLDELKDALFRLELRHQAGTISADDYARERQRIDQRLRELVQG